MSVFDTNGKAALHPVVFSTSAVLILIFLLLSFLYTRELGDSIEFLQTQSTMNAGWVYVLAVNLFLGYAIYLAYSRFGCIRLGGDDARPDFSYWGWLSMLFSAGMGIGLVFWSVAEPIHHFAAPPFGPEAGTAGAGELAMSITIFHWGLHAWGIYAIIALALAFFAYNRGLPLTIRSVFHPLLGDAIHGPVGNIIDVLAVLATMFGLATSLGLGARQVNAGLESLYGIASSTPTQIAIILLITAVAVSSVILGLERGVKRLSQINMIAAAVLLLFVLLAGPTVYLFDALLQNMGSYLQNLPKLAFWTETYRQSEWQHSWTIFYWAWWISWSPFVGMFIARISRGRTVKEFIHAVLILPTVLTMIWLTVFGGTALHQELFANGGITEAVNADVATALYSLLSYLPLSEIASMVAIFIVVTFFVTSSDSGSLVIDTITSGGALNPPVYNKIFWAAMEGLVACALLLAGGLKALQAGAILTGLPFAIVLIVMCYCLHRGLQEELSGI